MRVFDAKGKTFRDDWYPEYKANRPSMPDDLAAQIAPIHACVAASGWPILMVDGVEADDVIEHAGAAGRRAGHQCGGVHRRQGSGAAGRQACHAGQHHEGNEVLDEAGVLAKFGVPPERIVDYLALIGDTVDNVPGVAGSAPRRPSSGWRSTGRWMA